MMMRTALLGSLVCSALTTVAAQELPLEVAAVERQEPVDFGRDISPILKRKCLACHFDQEKQAGLSLETHEAVLGGGDSGTGIVPGNPDKSLVWLRATGKELPLMPPEDNSVGAEPLTPEELGMLRQWIAEGASPGEGSASSMQWQTLPDPVHPVYAAAVSPDGKWLARGRGDRVGIFDLKRGGRLQTLADPELSADVNDADDPVTHLGTVESIAFSPLGQRLATGGFRTVKIWRKHHRELGPTESPLARAAGPVAANSDGRIVAFVNAIGDLEVLDTETVAVKQTLPVGRQPIADVALSADGTRMASCDRLGVLTLWDATAGVKLWEQQVEASLSEVALHPRAAAIAAITVDGRVRFWRFGATEGEQDENVEPPNVEASEVEAEAIGQFAGVGAIAVIDEPSSQLVVGTEDGKVTALELESAAVRWAGDHGAAVSAIAVDAAGGRIASGGRDGNVRLWNAADGKSLEPLGGDPRGALLVRSDQRAVARQASLLKRLEARGSELEAAAKKERGAVEKERGERDQAAEKLEAEKKKRQQAAQEVEATQAAIASAGKKSKEAEAQIAALEEEIERARQKIEEAKKTIESTAEESQRLQKKLGSQRETLDQAVKAEQAGKAELEKRQQALNAASDSLARVERVIPQHETRVATSRRRADRLQQRLEQHTTSAAAVSSEVTGVAFEPGGDRIGAAHADGSARIFRPGEQTAVSQFGRGESMDVDSRPRGLVFQPDGTICVFAERAAARLWEASPSWVLERVIGSPDDSPISDRVTAIDFRPDGLSLAVGSGPPSRGGAVQLFSVATGELLKDYGEIHSDTVLGLEFSPDGDRVASASADKTVRLLEVATGDVIRSLEGHTHHVLSVAWKADGQVMASASADQTVKIWDVETGAQRRTISGFPKEVAAISFVAGTGRFATACGDGRVRLYGSANGKRVRSFDVASDFLYTLDVSEDGRWLASGGQSGRVQVWKLDDGTLAHEIR